jgi:CRISPR/Cas system-associated protein endoribonuclease Cas2
MTDLFTERDTKKAKAFVKGANTGIAQILGFPVDMVNMAPLLVNLLPGKQGMKPFSEDPVGGSQTFKNLMAAGNVGTYKDVQSIPKDEYGAGIAGMLSAEALTSLIPISQLVKGLPKGSKTVPPKQAATGVDLSRRDLLKKAGAAAVATAVSPSILKEAGDIISSPGVAKVGKTALSGSAIVAKSRALASQISDGMIESLLKKTKKGEKLSTKQLDVKTAEYNKVLDDLLKGKSYEDLVKLPKNDLADLYNQKNFSAHKGAGDPLRSKKYGPLLDKVFKDRGIGIDAQGNYKKVLRNEGDPPPPNLLTNPNAFDNAFGIKKMLPSENLIKKSPQQATKSIFAPDAKKDRQLLIVSCSDKKCPDVGNMKALDRYTGQLFTKMKAEGIPPNVDIAILSAKHGLIRSDTQIEKYDQLMTPEIRDKFISDPEQMKKIRDTIDGDYDKVFVTGGKNYRDVIDAAASDLNYEVIKKKAPGLTQQTVTDKLKEAKGIKVDRSKPLGVQNFVKDEKAYHFAFPQKIPGFKDKFEKLDIKKFDMDVIEARNKGYSVKYADTLGVHVGSQKAAQDRFLSVTGMFDEKEIGKEVGFDVKGQTYPLKIDTSKPFLDKSGQYSKDGVWTEDGLENYIQGNVFNVDDKYKKIMESSTDPIKKFEQTFVKEKTTRERELVKQFRKKLANDGFTNVPYFNDYEGGIKDAQGKMLKKELSQIMLIDRPNGGDVITSKVTGRAYGKMAVWRDYRT